MTSARPATDWERAFFYYAALPPQQRTYAAVAREFGVSVRTVEKHGLRECWRERADAIERQAAAEASSGLASRRAEQFADIQRLAEATLVAYAQRLRSGEVRLTPADLTRLYKLLQELWGDPDEPVIPVDPPSAPPSPDHMRDVLQALHDSGVLKPATQDRGSGR